MTRPPTKFQIMRRNREDHERLQHCLELRREAIESGYDVDSDIPERFLTPPPPPVPVRRPTPTFAALALRWRFWR
jgi:hypothetical protein